ncbi:hypothetical protein C8Q73DRAFT_653745 [Cubamyces lactineus]|nr:hypothetical protein C8Q73DRAFT_653745 [Cubamyces lactineus]
MAPRDGQNGSQDYLKVAEQSIPSFHFRTGKVPYLPAEIAPRTPANQFGYPQPGIQSPTPAFATAKHYFVDGATWENILDHGEFDDVVIGSGFCALAYVDAALKKDPWRKILILERGGFWLPEHFQNMPLPFKLVLGGPSETFPWQLSSQTVDSPAKFMHGSCPFFGGRSTFWSAWCPRPLRGEIDLMRDFPKSMKETANKEGFWERCEDLLHVTPANKITDPCFGQDLQHVIQKRLDDSVAQHKIPTAYLTNDAPLAVGRKTSIPNRTAFDKFSTPGPLLKIYERQRRLAKNGEGSPLMIAVDTVAERFSIDPQDKFNRPNVLHTSRGALCFPNFRTNIILAAGAFPAATLLLNSAGDRLNGRIGTRVAGHYISHITARFPKALLGAGVDLVDHLEIAASYLAGKDPKTGLQYHVQITAIHSPNPEEDAEDAARLCPDYAAAATAEQLANSQDYVVLVCATLGELDEKNPDSWVKHNPENPDVTTNIRLQVLPNANTDSCTEVMEEATYKAIEVMAGSDASKIEYWHDAAPGEAESAGWQSVRPPPSMIRVPGLVHETSMLYMSDNLEEDPHAAVDSLYRPYKCDNVFVTGGAIFPTSGSWNPTLTMCGFAQDLADKLFKKKQLERGLPVMLPPLA